MSLFLDILTKVTLPIITLAVLGYAMQNRLKLDIGTLNRIQVYVVMPAFLVHFLATAKQPLSAIWPVLGLGFLLFGLLIPIGWLTAVLFRQRDSLGPMMGLGAGYANVGFFGIPVAQLAFGPSSVVYMSVITSVVAILICTVGVVPSSPAAVTSSRTHWSYGRLAANWSRSQRCSSNAPRSPSFSRSTSRMSAHFNAQ